MYIAAAIADYFSIPDRSDINIHSDDLELDVKQEWKDTGTLLNREFDPYEQPEKIWKEIVDYEYLSSGQEPNIQQFVKLTYHGINKMHNVRVYNYELDKAEFIDTSCFQGAEGFAIVEENWITWNIIEHPQVKWEVEILKYS